MEYFFDTYENNLQVKQKLENYLKENYLLLSYQYFSFKYFLNIAI